jgi:hypothetical protein
MARDKGQKFERETARAISLWWSGGERDDVFWRNRVRITSKAFNAQQQCGDLQACHTSGLVFTEIFSIELKSGYSKKKTDSTKKKIAAGKAVKAQKVRNVPWDLLEVIDSAVIDDNLVILSFWKQCLSDAQLSGRIPILIFKRDFHSPVVVVDPVDFLFFQDWCGPFPPRRLRLIGIDLDLCFYRYDDFFEWLTPEAVMALHNSTKGIKDRIKKRKG